MELAKARSLAEVLVADLRPFCDRIEIAGSIRRKKPEVHDIELVAIPHQDTILDIFGQPYGKRNRLNDYIEGEYFCDKNGDRYKKIVYKPEINVDLFIVLPPMCIKCGRMFSISIGENNVPQENSEAMRDLWKNIQPRQSSRTADVQQKVLGVPELENTNGKGGEAGPKPLSGDMQELRTALHDERLQPNGILFDKMREDSMVEKSHSRAPEVDKVSRGIGMDTGSSDGCRLCGSLSSGASARNQERPDTGAQVGDGKRNGSVSGVLGESSSSERDQDGQPSREFGNCNAARPNGWVVCPHCRHKFQVH